MVDVSYRISGVIIHETALFLVLSVAVPLVQKKTVATACIRTFFLTGKLKWEHIKLQTPKVAELSIKALLWQQSYKHRPIMQLATWRRAADVSHSWQSLVMTT